jgi:hypothetical protein
MRSQDPSRHKQFKAGAGMDRLAVVEVALTTV